MFDEFLRKVADLRSHGASFAVATVVRFDGSISGKPGDKAIIYPDGRIWGWIGGGCTQPAVIKEALKSLDDGEPRFVRISPPPKPKSEPRIVDYTMACHSGGTLDVYIEPVLPNPRLIILGSSAIARYLAALARSIKFSVAVFAQGANREDFPDVETIQTSMELGDEPSTSKASIVVATQGEGDEEALQAALRTAAPYIAFVGSRAKAQRVFEFLSTEGVSTDQLSRVHSPAGLHIGAVAPEEIAISILAEIVQTRRTRSKIEVVEEPNIQTQDPVCGMKVDANRSRHASDWDGRAFHFCCSGCKEKFDRDPARYLN